MLYTDDLVPLIERHGLVPHIYTPTTLRSSARGIRQVHSLFAWKSVLPTWLAVDASSRQACRDREDLGMYTTMSMKDHISRLTSTCFGVLRQIRCIQRSLSSYTRTMLIACFVFARLDYCNTMFTVCPVTISTVCRPSKLLLLGSYRASESDHVTLLLRERHWLPVEHRVTFKMAVMTYMCVHSVTAVYLADYIRPTAPAASNLRLWSNRSGRLFVPRSKTAAEDQSIAVAGPRLWNSLPASVRHISRFPSRLQITIKDILV